MAEQNEAPQNMRVTAALGLVEQWIATQRNYQAAAVVKAAIEYITSLEERLAAIAAVEVEKAELKAAPVETETPPTVN